MNSRSFAAAARSAAFAGIPNPWVSEIGTPAIFPFPNTGITK